MGHAWVWTNLANLSQTDSCVGAGLVVQDATQESWIASQTCLVVSKIWVGQADRGNRALCPSSSRLVQGRCRVPKIRKRRQSAMCQCFWILCISMFS